MLVWNCKFRNKGITLIEALVALLIFSLMFIYTFKAFTPAATDAHNILRGVTIAISACNLYLNSLEQEIQYEGNLQSSDLGEHDITSYFTEELFSDIGLLRSLKVNQDVSLKDGLYTVKITFQWANNENAKERPHHFEMYRYIIQPNSSYKQGKK